MNIELWLTETKIVELGYYGWRWAFINHLVTENPFAGRKYLENTSNKIWDSCIDVWESFYSAESTSCNSPPGIEKQGSEKASTSYKTGQR